MRTDGGVIRDVVEDRIEAGKSPYSKNRVISEKFQASVNEPGFKEIAEYPGMVATGVISTDKDYCYYFLINREAPATNSTPTDCKIVKLGPHVNEIIIDDPALGFPNNHPITGVQDYNYLGEEIIGFNALGMPPSVLNVQKLPFALNSDNSLVNADDIKLLKIFPDIGTCNIHLREISDNGGALETGAYIFFIAYDVEEGFTSNYVQYSRPVYIYESSHGNEFLRIDGSEGGIVTAKSIGLGFTDLDPKYSKFTLSCIKIQNGIQTAHQINSYTYSGTSKQLTLTDLSNSTELPLEKLLIDFPEFTESKTIEISNSRLHLANLKRKPREVFDGQTVANAIQVNWVWEDMVDLVSWSGSHKDEVMIYDKQGFMADEVYALYIGFKFKDGTRSKAYHIPGREAQAVTLNGNDYNENDLISDIQSNDATLTQFNEDAAVSDKVRYFHTRETAKEDGTMGYWENQDEFYEDGSKVRHHKFPSIAAIENWKSDPVPPNLADYTPGYLGRHPNEAGTYDEGNPGEGDYGQRVGGSAGRVTRVLGLKLSNIEIPQSLREQIDSFEIFYAKRSLRNSTIIGQGYATFVHDNLAAGTVNRWEPILPNVDRILFYSFDMLSERVNTNVSFLKNYFSETTLNNLLYGTSPSTEPPANGSGGIDPASAEFITNIKETTFIPGGGEIENHAQGLDNMHGPFHELVPSTDIVAFLDNHSAAVVFKTNVYQNFEDQELVSTCIAFKVDAEESSYEIPKLYRGDTYSCYFAPYASSTRFDGGSENNGNVSCTGDADVRPVVVQSQKNISLRLSSDSEDKWYQKYYPKYREPFLRYYPPYFDSIQLGGGANSQADVNFRRSAMCWNDWEVTPIESSAGWGLTRQAAAAFLNDAYAFNKDYAVVFSEKSPIVSHFEDIEEGVVFPNLIARSAKKVEGEVYTSLRQFLVNEFYEMRRDRGEIIMLKDVNGELFIQCLNSLFKTVSQDTLPTDLTEIYLGSGNIFRSEPRELITSNKGYGGGQSQLSVIKTKQGLLTIDSYMGKVFQAGGEFKEISSDGMRNWFRENLPFWLQQNFPYADLTYDNAWAPNGLGTTCVFDEEYNRLIISKKDFRPVNPNSFTDLSLAEIQDQAAQGIFFFAQDGLIFRYNNEQVEEVDLENSPAWQNLSFTWSYSFDTGEWTCEHDYLLTLPASTRNSVFSWNKQKTYIHNEGPPGRYYDGITYPFVHDIFINTAPEDTKQVAGIKWVTRLFTPEGTVRNNQTIEKIALYNDRQCTGEISIQPNVNTDAVSQSWKFNKFRDIVVSEFDQILDENYQINEANLNPGLPSTQKRRLYGKYNVVRLIDTNTRGYAIYLLSLEANQRILK